MKAVNFLKEIENRVAQASVYRFCQLLEQSRPGHPLLGSTEHPADDPVRFRPDPGMGFPASELKGIEPNHCPTRPLPTVRTRLLGLYGVDSPLPTAYLDDIARRREGHEALEGFLDIFNHRMFTQFYRIWRKHSYPASFEAGGTDATSQCLFGLIGLGIPGTARQIGTPVSRFLALLGVMRLPTRNAEGVAALVTLLAPGTQAQITPHWVRKITLVAPASLSADQPVRLSQGMPIGRSGTDCNSQLKLTLRTDDPDETLGWLPGGQLHGDLLVLLRVYLGWRCTARLELSLPVDRLPLPTLGNTNVLLGMTAVLAPGGTSPLKNCHLTINLGCYHGLRSNPLTREPEHVDYRF
jgi:type VI secretion system protein ImpH